MITVPQPERGAAQTRRNGPKLIEVALPLGDINAASAVEKSLRQGHPSTLHLWWARRPLAACRAVIFAALVDDPSADPERFPDEASRTAERARLFGIIKRLVPWENAANESVLAEARAEILNCVGEKIPVLHDPFCGGGAIPIEGQRLGLPVIGTDTNPVAVLITRALTDIPWRFRDRRPIHPRFAAPLDERAWPNASGLAADVDAYGKALVAAARESLASYYPDVEGESNRRLTPIAWIWARTVTCPNPLCKAAMPLVKSFALSTRGSNRWAVDPVVDSASRTVAFSVRRGDPSLDGTVGRQGARCLVCGESTTLAYIRAEGRAERIGRRLMAVVADGGRNRAYVAASAQDAAAAESAVPLWEPKSSLPSKALGFRVQAYGMTRHADLFTPRQLLALTTFSDSIRTQHERIERDAIASGLANDRKRLEDGGCGATAYADAISLYLAFALDRLADRSSTLSSWDASSEKVRNVFSRQTLSMKWDFAEANPFSDSSGNLSSAVDWITHCLRSSRPKSRADIFLADAAEPNEDREHLVVTDPPYYDNVPYADLSDFFYTWLRSTILDAFPATLATLTVPKRTELVADPARFGGSKHQAKAFFEDGLFRAFQTIRHESASTLPSLIFYAFKQTSNDDAPSENRQEVEHGWETMLAALVRSGMCITGTWPITTELPNRQRAQLSNALASSVVLVCRPRVEAATITRADYLRELRRSLPDKLQILVAANLAATDLRQAAIGPGMEIFSRYKAVLEADDEPMTVRTALTLINEELSQIILGDVAEVDSETHFALSWFDRYGYGVGVYGEANDLLRATNANERRLRDCGVFRARDGKVQLLAPERLDDTSVAPASMPVWAKAVRIMSILVSETGTIEEAAGMLRAAGLHGADQIKSIAYHCYLVSERQKRASEARAFNALASQWADLVELARGGEEPLQGELV